MNTSLTAKAIFVAYRDKLHLRWTAGRGGEDRLIEVKRLQGGAGKTSLVGHVNFVRPNAIQIIGSAEFQYLQNLGKNSYADAIEQLFAQQPALVIFSDGLPLTSDFIDDANSQNVPLFTTSLSSLRLIDHLQYYLTNSIAENLVLHGVFMEVMGIGVLLAGDSGIGKSELALELITRGHRLIADDAPEFVRLAPDSVVGRCPDLLQDFLEVRGLGLLDIRAMFGENAIKKSERLRLVIQLERMADRESLNIDRLQGNVQARTVLDVDIAQITLPVVLGSNLAVLVEGAVRNYLLGLTGYDASQRFIDRQSDFMAQSDA